MSNAPAGKRPAPEPNSTDIDLSASPVSRADAAEIATLCVDGGVPAMTASLLREGVSLSEAKTRIAGAGKIRDAIALARRVNPEINESAADTFMAEGKTLEQVTAALFDKIVAKQAENEVRSHVEVQTSAHKPTAEASRANMKRQLKSAGLKKDD